MLVDDERREEQDILIRDNVTFRLAKPLREMTAVDNSFVTRDYLDGLEALRITQRNEVEELPVKVYINGNKVIVVGNNQVVKRIFFSPLREKQLTLEEISLVEDMSFFGSGHVIVPSIENADVAMGRMTVTEQVMGRVFVEERGNVRVAKGNVPRVIVGNSGRVDILAGSVIKIVDEKPLSGSLYVQKDPFRVGSPRTVVSRNMPSIR